MVSERLNRDEVTRVKLVSGGQIRKMICVNESGLYNVINRSDKPKAKILKPWVREVLSSIHENSLFSSNETADFIIDLLQEVKTANRCTV